jgi:hypothetical protein
VSRQFGVNRRSGCALSLAQLTPCERLLDVRLLDVWLLDV